MTEEQKAAYVIAMSACAMIKALGMMADNQQREHRGESMAYTNEQFDALIEEHGIHHNAVIERFTQ
jgi:hypothetical protein